MAKCDYCGKSIEKGTGKLFIRDSGKTLSFCSSKCEKYLLVYNKKARNLAWTADGRKQKEQIKRSKVDTK